MEIQWGIHYYLVNGELLTGKIYTNRYNMALEPSDWSRALIRVLMSFIYFLQNYSISHAFCIFYVLFLYRWRRFIIRNVLLLLSSVL